MIRRLLIALAVWYLRRVSPAHLAQSAQRRRRPQPTGDEAWWKREINAIGRTAAAKGQK